MYLLCIYIIKSIHRVSISKLKVTVRYFYCCATSKVGKMTQIEIGHDLNVPLRYLRILKYNPWSWLGLLCFLQYVNFFIMNLTTARSDP